MIARAEVATVEERDPRVKYAHTLSTMPGVKYISGEYFKRIYQKENPSARPVFITPHIGNTWIPINFMFGRLGFLTGTDLQQLKKGEPPKLVPAQAISDRTINLGRTISPEMVCFPFTVTVGYLGERLREFSEIDPEKRKDLYPIILVHESTGQCRERYYHLVQDTRLEDFVKELNKKIGNDGKRKLQGSPINFDMYAVKDSFGGVSDFITSLMNLSGRGGVAGVTEVWGLLKETILRYKMIQNFEDRVRYQQSLVASGNPNHPGDRFWALDKSLEGTKLLLSDPKIDTDNYESPKSFFEEIQREVKRRESLLISESLPFLKRDEPLGKIAIIGEILHAEDSGFVSGNYGRGFTSQGFYYEKHSGLSGYINKFDASLGNIFRILLIKLSGLDEGKDDELADLAAQGGLTHDVGGHGRETIRYIREEINLRLAGGWNYDAFFEAKPFGCIPQMIAENILRPQMGLEGIVYLPMSFDEQGGQAGIGTRLEQFCEQAEKSSRIWKRARQAREDYVVTTKERRIHKEDKWRPRHRPIPGIPLD